MTADGLQRDTERLWRERAERLELMARYWDDHPGEQFAVEFLGLARDVLVVQTRPPRNRAVWFVAYVAKAARHALDWPSFVDGGDADYAPFYWALEDACSELPQLGHECDVEEFMVEDPRVLQELNKRGYSDGAICSELTPQMNPERLHLIRSGLAQHMQSRHPVPAWLCRPPVDLPALQELVAANGHLLRRKRTKKPAQL